MDSRILTILVLAGFLGLGWGISGSVWAGEKGKDAKQKVAAAVRVKGVVSTTRDAEGRIAGVKLSSDKGVFLVVLDAKGQALGKLDGKRVEVTGTVVERGGRKWLTVQGCKGG